MDAAALPIDAVLTELLTALEQAPCAILAAPPGAGKTTRVPLAMLDAPWRDGRKIVMLEPRRIAARAAAERLADGLGERPGARVGYRIRGESVAGRAIEVVTEGVLTRMLHADPSLDGIAAVLFDEAHERSIHGDLGLALALEAQEALRPDLRLVVMSATLDVAAFAAVMRDPPVIESQGRAYPVETRWRDRPWRRPGQGRRGLEQAAADLVARALAETGPDGDLLVFLPGAGEIARVQALLAGRTEVEVKPLHGGLPFAEQRAVLNRPDGAPRRVILATDIAETSLTVPGVRVVIDAGFARGPSVDPATGLTRLVTSPVSRASADQRRGRAGRLGPGICYRMWTKGEDGALPAFAPPEILASDLAPLALDVALWGAAGPEALRLPTQPSAAGFAAAQTLLRDLGALDAENRITDRGRAMAGRALPPRLAHMLIAAEADGQGAEAAFLAALMAERDPLRGGPANLADRVRMVLGGRADPGLTQRIKAEALRRADGLPKVRAAEQAAPHLAALAYPDRIAQRRPGDAPRYLLANGRGAVLAADDPLASAPYLVATDLEDGPEARIRQAAPLTERDLRDLFGPRIETVRSAVWSPRTNRVDARIQERLGAIALTDRLWRDAPNEALAAALADGIRAKGLAALPWPDAALRLRARAAWLRGQGVDDAPDWSDETLLARLDDWLVPHLGGMTTIEATRRLDWAALLKAMDWDGAEAVDRHAPASVETPLGRRVPVDYAQDQPRIAVKVQEMFGVTVHPMAAGRPLLIELLSPAGRPVQTTADLPGFWATSYKDVRKDMRARYPKHPWPEDPAAAHPTTRARRRAD